MKSSIETRQVTCQVTDDYAHTFVYLTGKVEFEAAKSGTLTLRCEGNEIISICFTPEQAQQAIDALTAARLRPIALEELPSSSQFILGQANILMAGGGK